MTIGTVPKGERSPAVHGPTEARTSSDKPKLVIRGYSRKDRSRSLAAQKALRMSSPLVLLVLWELAAGSGAVDARFFPAPSTILAAGVELARSGMLLEATAVTLQRVLLGYFLGAALGVVIGLWLGLSSWSRTLLEPMIQLTYPVPKLAVYPLLLLLVGTGERPMILLLAIATFYLVVISTVAAVLTISQSYLDVGRDNDATFLQFFVTIALPGSLPQILTGLELALGIAYILVIAVEFLGAQSGIGYIIWSSWQVIEIQRMFVGVSLITILGYVSVIGLRAFGGVLTPWLRTAK